MGLFVYTQKGSIISMVDLPTTEIIEPQSGPWVQIVLSLPKRGSLISKKVLFYGKMKKIRF